MDPASYITRNYAMRERAGILELEYRPTGEILLEFDPSSGDLSFDDLNTGPHTLSALAAGVDVGNTAFVDAVNGDDASGTVGRLDKPYLTIQAAVTACSAGQVVIVGPGTYDEAVTCKDDVSVVGVDMGQCKISRASTTTEKIFEMADNMRLANFTLELSSTSGITYGIYFGGTTNSTSIAENVTVSASSGTVYAVYDAGTGTSGLLHVTLSHIYAGSTGLTSGYYKSTTGTSIIYDSMLHGLTGSIVNNGTVRMHQTKMTGFTGLNVGASGTVEVDASTTWQSLSLSGTLNRINLDYEEQFRRDIQAPASTTVGAIPTWGATDGDSLQDNAAVGISGGNLEVKSGGEYRAYEATDTNYTALQASASIAANDVYTLPAAQPVSDGQVLTSTTAGVMSWTDKAGSATFRGCIVVRPGVGNTETSGNYSARKTGSTGQTYFSFVLPSTFGSLSAAYIYGIPNSSGASLDIDLKVDISAAGEDAQTHTASDTTSTYTVTANETFRIDISSLLTAATAGDHVGVHIDHNGIGFSIGYTALVVEFGITGSGVLAPGSSTDNAVVRWDGATGDTVQNSGVLIDDSDNVSGIVDLDITGDFSVDTDVLFVDSANNRVGINFGVPATDLDITRSAVGSDLMSRVYNSDNTNAASHAYMRSHVGGSSGGDPVFSWIIEGGVEYVAGIDNSDGDKWKLSKSHNLGTSDVLVIEDSAATFSWSAYTANLWMEGQGPTNAATLQLKDGATGNYWGFHYRDGSHLTEADDLIFFYYTGSFSEKLRYDVSASQWVISEELGISSQSGSLARLSADQSINSATWTDIVCDSEFYDENAEYDTTTGKFTTTHAGKYVVGFKTVWRDVVANKYYYIALYAGGSLIASIEETAEANQIRVPVSMSFTVEVAASAEIYVRAYHNSGSAKSLAGNSYQTVFSVARVA